MAKKEILEKKEDFIICNKKSLNDEYRWQYQYSIEQPLINLSAVSNQCLIVGHGLYYVTIKTKKKTETYKYDTINRTLLKSKINLPTSRNLRSCCG